MNRAPPPRGRPQGQRRADLRNWVNGYGRFTLGELVRATAWPVNAASMAVCRALNSGDLQRVGTQRVAHAKRPVAVYEPVRSHAPEPQGAALLAQALRGWGG